MGRNTHTTEEIISRCAELNIKIIDKNYIYKNTRERIDCIDCDGYKYSPTVHQILDKRQNKFNKVYRGNKYTAYNIQLYLDKNNTGATLIVDDNFKYDTNRTILTLKCKCGNIFNTYWNHILNANKTKCYKCGQILRHNGHSLSIHDLIKRYNEYNIPIEINFDEYINKSDFRKQTDLLECKCIECGNWFRNKWNYIYYNHSYLCNKCSKKQSAIEKTVENYLKCNGIKYEKQKTFIGCKKIKPLPFDFYLIDYNCAIEVQGRQHYYESNYFAMPLEKRQEYDRYKKEYCENNDILYIAIPYYNIHNEKFKYTINNMLGIN